MTVLSDGVCQLGVWLNCGESRIFKGGSITACIIII